MRPLIALLLAITSLSQRAAAHGIGEPTSSAQWTFDPWILSILLVLSIPFAIGSVGLLLRARKRRDLLSRTLLYAAGWLTLAAALVSPLHWLGERLLTFHMIEHEILMAVSAPLMVAARPLAATLWGLPQALRETIAGAIRSAGPRALWRWATGGANATLLHAIAIWGWHLPIAFDAAVTDSMLHRLQHLSFFGTAVLFWWSVLWRSPRGVAAWHVFITMMHTGVLGALMALSPKAVYATKGADLWGMTAIEDQQLAGLVMWIPAGTVYAGAALAMTAFWIKGSSRGASHARAP